MTYSEQHLREAIAILERLDTGSIERVVDLLAGVRREGGGSSFSGWEEARKTARTP